MQSFVPDEKTDIQSPVLRSRTVEISAIPASARRVPESSARMERPRRDNERFERYYKSARCHSASLYVD